MFKFHTLPAYFEAPGAEGGAGGGTSENPENNNGDGAGEGAQRTFTQADVDRIAAEARGSGRSKALADLLKELGTESLDSAKSLLKAAQEARQASMSELERAQERIKALEAAESERTTLSERLTVYDEAITTQVEALVKELAIPKYVVDLLDGKTPLEQLNYINQHRASFAKPTPPDIDAAARGGGSQRRPTKEELRARKRQSGRYGAL